MITNESCGLRPLDRPDCLWRLTHAVVGRVAWAGCGGRAVLVPVNFVIDGPGIVFLTAAGGHLFEAVRSRSRLTFEADGTGPASDEGWSVLLSGRPEIITDRGKVRSLEQHPLAAWARVPHRRFVRMAAEEITGHVMPLRRAGTEGPAG
ncbi:pyridoxamine 5'-phosphate oxidase family protein [Actinomadura sp. NPDC048394]|jgi:nitroimidazol reductase NimA-like FMN-containing flavoprotein (pyridoxamine 5'-phosphate oxidase superfamily)|uniref:pyridoxamine 5'-phosphate oxidase family protein n=1 Tax=Actinomadura sp. NPDC048394 TaxID=3158223 RepID=UPI003411BCA6